MSNVNIRWNEEELLTVVRSIPAAVVKDYKRMAGHVEKNGWNKEEATAVLSVVANGMPDIRKVGVPVDSNMTFGELYDLYDKAMCYFIVVLRVNYLLHQSMITVYDLLERDNLLRFSVKKNHLQAEKMWDEYEGPRRKHTQREVWFTLQDHLRIAEDILRPKIEQVYVAIRDHMIRMGWRDVETKARIEFALLMSKVATYSLRAFIKDFKDDSGIDFTKCFAYADQQMMSKYFVQMVNALGIKTEKDQHGMTDLSGFSSNDSQRFKTAWNSFMESVRDNDLMDDAASRAIELNPAIYENYHEVMKNAERAKMFESVEKLKTKFKVTKEK